MIRVCPTASTSSTMPLMRMNSHIQSSNPPTGRSRPAMRPRGGCGGSPAEGVVRSIVVAISGLRSQEVDDLSAHDRGHDERRGGEHERGRTPHGLDVTGEAWEEIDQGDLDAVDGMEEHGEHEPE